MLYRPCIHIHGLISEFRHTEFENMRCKINEENNIEVEDPKENINIVKNSDLKENNTIKENIDIKRTISIKESTNIPKYIVEYLKYTNKINEKFVEDVGNLSKISKNVDKDLQKITKTEAQKNYETTT